MNEDERRRELAAQITGPLARRYSTATVLLHHAVAQRLGLGPRDLKCLGLVVQWGLATGSQLAAVTGLTSGAVTGVVARLLRAGYVRRETDPRDKLVQIIHPVPERIQDAHHGFASLRPRPDTLLDGFDGDQLEVIAEFLTRLADFNSDRAATLRVRSLTEGSLPRRPAHDLLNATQEADR